MSKPSPVEGRASAAHPAPPAAPRRAWLWVTLVHLAATLALGFPALAGNLLLNPRSDQYIAGYAFREFARQHFLETGSIPQWNPFLFGGMPFVDAMHGDTFYPTALLRILIGTGPGMTWGLLIHVFLAGVFSYAFLRAMGLSFFAALLGGVAYQMGGNIAGLVSPGHDGKLFIAALLPLALLLVTRGVRDGQHWAWGPLALVTGLAVLSPHPQLLQYMLLVVGAFALFLALGWGSNAPTTVRRVGMQRLALSLGAIALGMLMGAIQFWPVRYFTPWSPRAGGPPWEHAISYSMPPEEVINFALPQFSGILDGYWGRNAIHFHSEYIGVAVLVLAVLGLGRWTLGSERRLTWFFAGTFVIALLWALGGYTPFYHLVYAIVPGTKYFRAPSTMLFVVAFSASMLAAFGTERVLRGESRRGVIVGAGIAVGLLALLGVSGVLTNMSLGIETPHSPDTILANEGALRGGALRMLMFGALACLAAFLIGTRRVSRDLAGALLIGIVGIDLWSVVRHYWIFSAPASELYASDASIQFLQQQPGPFRVFAADFAQSAGRDPILRYDGLMVHRIPVVHGYHGNHIAKYDLLTGDLRQFGNPNLWRLVNMQYFLANVADIGVEGAKVVAGPVKNAYGNDVWVHEVPIDASYAWITPAMVKADEQAVVATLFNPQFDVRQAALFDTSAAVQGAELTAPPQPLDIRARVTRYGPGTATIVLDAPAPAGSALMVSENYYPGWTATVDGKPAVVGRADVSLIGVALPEGGRTIELAFVNEPYQTGRLVTRLAVLVALLLWAAGAVAERRRRASV
jgi:hypothetical protein